MNEEDFLKSLLVDFKKETQEFIENIEHHILEFEKTKDDSSFRQIQQDLHSIKGSAQASDLEDIADLTHKIEEAIQQQSTGVDQWLQMVDQLSSQISSIKI